MRSSRALEHRSSDGSRRVHSVPRDVGTGAAGSPGSTRSKDGEDRVSHLHGRKRGRAPEEVRRISRKKPERSRRAMRRGDISFPAMSAWQAILLGRSAPHGIVPVSSINLSPFSRAQQAREAAANLSFDISSLHWYQRFSHAVYARDLAGIFRRGGRVGRGVRRRMSRGSSAHRSHHRHDPGVLAGLFPLKRFEEHRSLRRRSGFRC